MPKTDAVLAELPLAGAMHELGPALVKRHVVQAQHQVRAGELTPEQLTASVLATLPATAAESLHPVLNATGVLLHTNIGRAPLSDAAKHPVSSASGWGTDHEQAS